MNALYWICMFLIVAGVAGIPGCIEFGTGWIQTIAMLVVGAIGVVTIPRYHYEKWYK